MSKTSPKDPNGSQLHGKIAVELARRLASGEWAVGSRMPSYRTFANEFKVSLRTIQLAFKLLKKDGLVRVAPQRMAVAALGAPLTAIVEGAVVLVLKSNLHAYLGGDWYEKIWRGVVQGTAKDNHPLVILQHEWRWRHEFPAGLQHLPLKGVLLLGPFSTELLRQYEHFKWPVALLDQPGDELKLHSVSASNYEAAFEATSRLIGWGHRRIAFLRRLVWSLKRIDPDARERQEGFVAACRKGRLKESDYAIFTGSASDSGFAVRQLLSAKPRFGAVVATDPLVAEQLAQAAGAEKLKIPTDLSIVSVLSSLAPPQNWSGMRVDAEAFGWRGVELLQRRSSKPQRIRMRATWHEGATAGPPSVR